MAGPAAVKSSPPILNAPTTGASSRARDRAASADGRSSATMMGFCVSGAFMGYEYFFENILRDLDSAAAGGFVSPGKTGSLTGVSCSSVAGAAGESAAGGTAEGA